MTSVFSTTDAPALGAATQSPAQSAGTSAAASKFESMVIGQMLQPMFETVEEDKTFGGGPAESMLKPMLVTEYANLMEQRGGLGLDQVIQQELSQTPKRGK